MRKRLLILLYVIIFALYSSHAHAHFGSYMYIPPIVTHTFSLVSTLGLVAVFTRQDYAQWILAYFGLFVLSLMLLISPAGVSPGTYMFAFFAPLCLMAFSAIRLWLNAKNNKKHEKISGEQAKEQSLQADE